MRLRTPTKAALIALAMLLPASVVRAACVSPAGVGGDIMYNATYQVLQFCNNTYWMNAGAAGIGGIGVLTATKFCTTDGSIINCTTNFTGTGNVVLSASPTLTGTITAAAANFSGTVGIGTTGLSSALQVEGQIQVDAANYGRMMYSQAGTNVWSEGPRTTTDFYIYRESGTGNVFIPSGNVGIGTATVANTLDVNGKASIGYVNTAAPTNGLAVSGNVGIGTPTPIPTAALDVTSTTQGFAPPRMTRTQRDAIASPAAGIMVYDTTDNQLTVYNGTSWQSVSLGVATAGNFYCWGDYPNAGGVSAYQTPTYVSMPSAFSVFSQNAYNACGLSSTGYAFCTGWNPYGAVGNGTTTAIATYALINSGGPTFSTIAVGYVHTCALTTTGAAYCWGYNADGEVGDGTTTSPRTTPTAVTGGLSFTQLAVGVDDSCGLTSSGTAYCWGYNGYGAVGDGTTTSRSAPTAVTGGHTFSTITVSNTYYYATACALDMSGAAWCWGNNTYGPVGNGTVGGAGAYVSSPTAVLGSHTFTKISAGAGVTCALDGTGAAWCWGDGSSGDLGNGLATSSGTPVAVSGGITFTDIKVGALGACGLANTGTVYCWGYNAYYNVGDGTTTQRNTPVAIGSGRTFGKLFGGGQYYASNAWQTGMCAQ